MWLQFKTPQQCLGVKVQSALLTEKITLPYWVKVILSCMAGIRVSCERGLAEFKMATKTPKSSIVMCFSFNTLLGLCTHIFTYIFDKLMKAFYIQYCGSLKRLKYQLWLWDESIAHAASIPQLCYYFVFFVVIGKLITNNFWLVHMLSIIKLVFVRTLISRILTGKLALLKHRCRRVTSKLFFLHVQTTFIVWWMWYLNIKYI